MSHNHPSIMISCWEKVSAVVYGFLRAAAPEIPPRPWKGPTGNTFGFISEKMITAAIKVAHPFLPFLLCLMKRFVLNLKAHKCGCGR